jgi:hypothetical protein
MWRLHVLAAHLRWYGLLQVGVDLRLRKFPETAIRAWIMYPVGTPLVYLRFASPASTRHAVRACFDCLGIDRDVVLDVRVVRSAVQS